MVNYEPFQHYGLCEDYPPCPICGSECGDCECQDLDDEWRENAESEIAAAENLEEK